MGKNKVEKVMKKLCVCTLSVVIGMLSIQIMPVSAASKTGMGKITNKINKAGYNLWGGYDSPEEAATYDIDFYDSGINAGVETALVLTGEATRKDAEESSYKPDYIFPTVRELHEAWK